MAYELLHNGRTQFAIDWDVVGRLVRSYHTACLQWTFSREVTLSESSWYNPMSWSLPDVSHVEVDWDAVRSYASRNTDEEVRELRAAAATDASRVAWRLTGMIETTAVKKEAFVDWLGTVQTRNMQSIHKAVDDYESHVDVARFVRDTSADGLMVGASVVTGGTAVAALGGASFVKGACKFQDTGSVGAAVMEGAGSFTFAYVKLGKSFSFKDNVILALVQAPYKTGTELVGGATLSTAVLKGGLKLTGPATDALFKLGPVKTIFDKAAIPIVITSRMGGGTTNVASQVLAKFTDKVQARGVETWAKSTLSERSQGKRPEPMDRTGRLISDATLTDVRLLWFAFVNMDKGIGRGW